MTERRPGPVLIELDTAPEQGPDIAPPIQDLPRGPAAMERAVTLAARPPSRVARWFWGLLISLVGIVISVAAWDFATGLLARSPVLGSVVSGLIGAFVLVALILVLREAAAFARLARIDGLRSEASAALVSEDPVQAKRAAERIAQLYAARGEMTWALDRYRDRSGDVFDAKGHLGLVEQTLLEPLDTAATRAVEGAARQVATVTALVPLALVDVVTALTANLRMIRQIADIYGGRGGALGNWRLTRSVMAHLVATGAVAVGDDMIGSVAGGGLVAKLSRRFGEGIINGALTARVGVAAMEVCRPMPFTKREPPSVTALVRRALTGLFGQDTATRAEAAHRSSAD